MSEHAEPTPPPIIPRAPYQLMPALAPAEEEALRASIAEHGVMVPIMVDEHGTVIDGHHRQRIAAELGVDCPHIVRAELPEHEKRLQAVVMNMARRHSTDAQRVLVGRKIESDLAKRAEANRTANLPTVDAPSVKAFTLGRTTDAVAKAVGIGTGRTYENHKKVIEQLEKEPDGPALIEKLETGEWTMRDAAKAVRWRRLAEKVRTFAAHDAMERTVVQIPHTLTEAIAQLNELDRDISDLRAWQEAIDRGEAVAPQL